jgi:hypothetical protein
MAASVPEYCSSPGLGRHAIAFLDETTRFRELVVLGSPVLRLVGLVANDQVEVD